jgi:hypothetical protein
MRVLSSLVAAAWLLTLAEPCLRPAVCGTGTEHQCCCDKHEQCSCQLRSHRAPAPPLVAASAEASKDQQSLPAAENTAQTAALVTAAALARTFSGPAALPTPFYLSSHAFRC